MYKKRKIALINYYLRMEDYPTRYSLAVLRLAEYLMSYENQVEIIPIGLESELDEKTIHLLKEYPIIGISNYIWSNKKTRELYEKLINHSTNQTIIIGGPECIDMNPSDWKDAILVLGEGENALKEILDQEGKITIDFLKQHENIINIEKPEGKIIEQEILYKNPLFTNIKDIDKDFLYYETSRGCYYQCGYCGFRNRHQVGYFPLEIIEQEIKNIGNLKFKEIFVVDANFGGNKERGKKIMKMFEKYAKNTIITCYMRPEYIDDEFIEILKHANLKEIRIGIQTVNEEVPVWVRSNSIYHVKEELPKLSQANIPWKAELIIGLPNDNMKGLKTSIDFVENTLKPTIYSCYPLTIIKDTPIYSLLDKTKTPWLEADEHLIAYASSSYTHEELEQMKAYAKKRIENYQEMKIKHQRVRK